jgi:hypothetical protein
MVFFRSDVLRVCVGGKLRLIHPSVSQSLGLLESGFAERLCAAVGVHMRADPSSDAEIFQI